MNRIKNLNRFQKGILIALLCMFVVFTGIYSIVSSRYGFLYMNKVFVPGTENGVTVYHASWQSQEFRFEVTEDGTVTFYAGHRKYGPYSVRENSAAIPEEHPYTSGVEILEGEEVIFRGGVFLDQEGRAYMLFDEEGNPAGIDIYYISPDTVQMDLDGNVMDPLAPSALTILQLAAGPELTSKGEWKAWFCGLFLSAAISVSIVFADDIFRWNMAFHIRNAQMAEPSDWEIKSRYATWTLLCGICLFVYCIGLV